MTPAQAPAPPRDSIEEWLIEWIAKELGMPPAEIETSKSLLNYSLSSVTAMMLVGDLEEWLGLTLPPTLVWDYPSIAAIADYLMEQVGSPAADAPAGTGAADGRQTAGELGRHGRRAVCLPRSACPTRRWSALLNRMMADENAGASTVRWTAPLCRTSGPAPTRNRRSPGGADEPARRKPAPAALAGRAAPAPGPDAPGEGEPAGRATALPRARSASGSWRGWTPTAPCTTSRSPIACAGRSTWPRSSRASGASRNATRCCGPRSPRADDRPVELVGPEVPPAFSVVGPSGRPRRRARGQDRASWRRRRRGGRSTWRGARCWRVKVLRWSDEGHDLVLAMHHIVSDAWSFYVFCRELAECYDASRSGRPPGLAELPIQYAEFAQRQRQWLSGRVYEEQLAYWRGHLGGEVPALRLPADRPALGRDDPSGIVPIAGDPGAGDRALGALSRRENATLFMTLLAGFEVLLHRYSGQEDLVLCTPASGRHRSRTKDLIGYFNNILPMRFDLTRRSRLRRAGPEDAAGGAGRLQAPGSAVPGDRRFPQPEGGLAEPGAVLARHRMAAEARAAGPDLRGAGDPHRDVGFRPVGLDVGGGRGAAGGVRVQDRAVRRGDHRPDDRRLPGIAGSGSPRIPRRRSHPCRPRRGPAPARARSPAPGEGRPNTGRRRSRPSCGSSRSGRTSWASTPSASTTTSSSWGRRPWRSRGSRSGCGGCSRSSSP